MKMEQLDTCTLLIATNIVEPVRHTVATVTTSIWPNNWDAWWPVPLKFP